ncbi:hypothetical protein [Spirosoma utsteinense]|uniref:AMIN domain-containing protein n=1 Tax=Spirosoma utsteinense TaxID=2585773 RepID=A0ABR6WC64_9BACT|nr:hypothetical protein [Spirosoma utsteinense]MBC3788722.1 hypothetical protein [Spirosoma utsteinense]MBC3794160.1 hypothetical protein [Spirosoma utsteinense]
MKGLNFNSRSSFLSICLSALLLLASYQEASSVDRSTVVQTLNGKVMVKLEPHGSVRARVFQGKKLQYEFILDRETQQKLLTQNIDRANIYLVGEHGEELIIDDLKTQKRFVLSMFDQESKFKNIPSARTRPIVIKGYSVSLID